MCAWNTYKRRRKKDKKREKRLKGIWCVRMVCGLFLGKTHEKSMNAWYSRQELSGASFTQSTKGWIKAKGKSSSIVFYSILCVFWLLLFLVFHFIRKLLESIFEIGHWPYSWFRLEEICWNTWFIFYSVALEFQLEDSRILLNGSIYLNLPVDIYKIQWATVPPKY